MKAKKKQPDAAQRLFETIAAEKGLPEAITKLAEAASVWCGFRTAGITDQRLVKAELELLVAGEKRSVIEREAMNATFTYMKTGEYPK